MDAITRTLAEFLPQRSSAVLSMDASKASTTESPPQPRTYHAADPSHALVALLEARGWAAAASAGSAAVVLPAKGAPLPCAPRPGQHVWCNGCLALACKARLFEA